MENIAPPTASKYSPQDTAFLRALKAKGVGPEEAFNRLRVAKLKTNPELAETVKSGGLPSMISPPSTIGLKPGEVKTGEQINKENKPISSAPTSPVDIALEAMPGVGGTLSALRQGEQAVKAIAGQPKEETSTLGSLAIGGLKDVGEGVLGASELAAKGMQAVTEPLQNAIRPAVQSVTEPIVGQLGKAPTTAEGFGNMSEWKDRITKATNPTEEAGKIMASIGQFLLPAGAIGKGVKAVEGITSLTKAPKLVKAGAKLLTGAGLEGITSGAITAAKEGDINQNVAINTALGAALPVVGAAGKGLGKASGEVAKYLSSSFSGVPIGAIEHAITNPKAVQTSMKKVFAEGGNAAAQRVYKDAIQGVNLLQKARSDAYAKGLKEVEKLAPVHLSTEGVQKTANEALNKFGVRNVNGILDGSEAAIDKSHINNLQEIVDRISGWKDNTPTGLNKLRQIVDSYKKGGVNLGSSEKQFNKIVGEIRTNLVDYVGEQVPQIAKLNKEWATQSEVIDQIASQLKTNSKDPNTALRKLLNVFNPKSTVYRPIVEELGTKASKNLMSDIAAITMSKWTPEGLGKYLSTGAGGALGGISLANPAAAVAAVPLAAAASPRIIGKVATKLGQIEKSQALKKGEELLKAGIKAGMTR